VAGEGTSMDTDDDNLSDVAAMIENELLEQDQQVSTSFNSTVLSRSTNCSLCFSSTLL